MVPKTHPYFEFLRAPSTKITPQKVIAILLVKSPLLCNVSWLIYDPEYVKKTTGETHNTAGHCDKNKITAPAEVNYFLSIPMRRVYYAPA